MSVAYRFRIRATSAINSANFSACGGSLRRLSHLLVDSAAAGCRYGSRNTQPDMACHPGGAQ